MFGKKIFCLQVFSFEEEFMGVLAYLSICIFWGLSSIATKIGLKGIEPFAFSFFRFFVTAMILLIYNLVQKKSLLIGKEDFKVISISATVMYFLNSMLIAFATKRLDAGLIPILFALVPVVMVIIESIMNKKLTVGIIGFIGIVGGILGIGIVSFVKSGTTSVDLFGIMLMLLAVLSWAGGSIYFRTKSIKTSITVILFYQSLLPMILYGAAGIVCGEFLNINFDTSAISGILYMSIADTLVGSACYVYLLKHWKISIVSTYAYVNPIVGLAGSYFLLGEGITLQKITGMLVILLSVFLIQYDSKMRAKLNKMQ